MSQKLYISSGVSHSREGDGHKEQVIKKCEMCYWLTFMIDRGLIEEWVTSFARDSGPVRFTLSLSPRAEILNVL